MTQTPPADKLYDVNEVIGYIGGMLGTVRGQPDFGATTQSWEPNSNGQPDATKSTKGSATPMSGTLADGSYDGFGITNPYGGESGHPGIDIGTPVGTKLIAPITGTVTHAGDDDPSGYGSWVEITGDDGIVIRYGHLSSLGVNQGDQVGPGTFVGLSGGAQGEAGSGNATGPHLHFEVRQGNHTVDPSSFLAGGWQIMGA